MNPLTLVKRIQSINAKEAELGISDEASWHAKYKDSAYVFVGGIPYDLTEGDLLAVFAQYGEIVDVNLVRDKATGKSKGFSFVAYEDQRSTILAVDNLNGAQIAGRTIRVDHVSKYKKKEEEDEEAERQKREERGVCRAFQKGECKYGDSCRFSHDEQRAADTGWGPEEDRRSKLAHDKFNMSEPNKRMDNPPPTHASEKNRVDDFDRKRSRKDNTETVRKQMGGNLVDSRERGPKEDRRSKWTHDKDSTDYDRKRYRGNDNTETDSKQIEDDLFVYDREKRGMRAEAGEKRIVDRKSRRYEPESKPKNDYDERQGKRSINEKESSVKDNPVGREKEREKRSFYTTKDSSPRRERKDGDERKERTRDDDYRKSHR